ncbi:hypothetical protein [Fodinicola feengrottensis]|uniref:hypothetical protein n=1 Tax=Fodinicola feengrottensis TaxID=435914 RepID=UPI0013D3C17B|nr:hypothetical protein [Fodinicola feengrottensis]
MAELIDVGPSGVDVAADRAWISDEQPGATGGRSPSVRWTSACSQIFAAWPARICQWMGRL